MKILVYGDSNVWGDNFLTGERIPKEEQWPVILQKQLGNDYEVIQEGLPGRVAGSVEKVKTYKNGKETFMSTFRTWAPLDMVIIMLGTNDLQSVYKRNNEEIFNDLKWYKEKLEDLYIDLDDRRKFFKERLPKFIFITPVKFDYKNGAKDIFNNNSFKEYMELRSLMKKSFGEVIDANGLDLIDGIHLSKEGHEMLAELVYRKIVQ